ncbi:MAG: ABC transporter permease [Lachnospiraceae bacterium]|nr:ABC transporter permease [Lachnospiraceae bacterium]
MMDGTNTIPEPLNSAKTKAEEGRRPGGKKKKREGVSGKMLSLTCFVLLVGLWCAGSYGGWVSDIFLPSPTAVLEKIISMAKDGSLWANCWESTSRVLIGWVWSVIIALPMGMLMANSKKFSAFVQPIIEFARYLPVVALVPLTLLYLGIGETQKYTIIFLGTFFQLVLMICDTVSSVDKNMINAARTLGAGRFQVYKEVIFPAALPGLMDDFRLTIGWAWTYLVVAEMVAASNGLGYMILRSQRYLATDTIFAGLILIGLIGLLTDWLFRILTRIVAPWQERLTDAK